MKLASYHDGSRDGQLLVVSRDLRSAHYASGVAQRLQQVLEDWNFLAPQLQDVYDALNAGRARHAFPFDPWQCLSPLPRAYRWAWTNAYPSHVERVHAGAAPAQRWRHDPADAFARPCAALALPDDVPALDFSAGLAVVGGDVAPDAGVDAAREGVRLVMLSLALHEVGDDGAAAWPLATAFSPVAVTPDELGDAWRGGRVFHTLQVLLNGRRFGLCESGPEMAPDFGGLLAQLARQRGVAAGSIVGGGAVSNADAARGFCSLREKRAVEAARDGHATTAWLGAGDSLAVEMKGHDGASVFGAIECTLGGD